MENKLPGQNPPPQPVQTPIPPPPVNPPPVTPPPAVKTPDISMPPDNGLPKWLLILIVVLTVGVLTALVVAGWQLLKLSNETKTAPIVSQQIHKGVSITGTIGLDGIPPQGSYINVVARKVGNPQFKTVVSAVAPVDGKKWAWNGAETGGIYEMQAQIIMPGGVDDGDSPIYVVAAPAINQVLNVNVNPAVNPTPSAPPNITPTPILSSISGTFNLNGYIPNGATINIAARQVGSQNFTTVASSLPAVDNASWSWTNAIQNTSYEVQATLNDGNNDQSQVITITAPASNEILTINSTVAPATPATTGVSGTINLNGSIPSGAYITLGERVTGTTTFNQVASNISATNGVSWTWGGATTGTSYDFQAYLWVNNQPSSQSQILTVDAPATGEVLTINSQPAQPSAPAANTISASCGKNSSGYQATVNYNVGNTLTNAQQYWITIGTTGGGSNIISNTVAPTNPGQAQSYTSNPSLAQGQTYYTQYAYATCNNCNTFSSFSPTITFTCN